MKLLLLALKNLRRNKVRATLTAMAMILLAAVFCMIATVLKGLSAFTAEKARDVKLIVTERYRIPSSFDTRFVDQMIHSGSTLNSELSRIPGFDPDKYNVWHFIGFTLDPEMRNKDLQFLAIGTLPDKLIMMTDSLEGVDPRVVDLVRMPPLTGLPNTGLVMGETRLRRLNKRVGDVLKAKSFTHRQGDALRLPIEMEFEIVGVIPSRSQWADAAFMDYAYVKRVLQEKKSPSDGKVDLAWLMVADQKEAEQVSVTIERNIRDLNARRCPGIRPLVRALRDFFWGIKFVVRRRSWCDDRLIANAVGITVRERTSEMAILKVLGFRRNPDAHSQRRRIPRPYCRRHERRERNGSWTCVAASKWRKATRFRLPTRLVVGPVWGAGRSPGRILPAERLKSRFRSLRKSSLIGS